MDTIMTGRKMQKVKPLDGTIKSNKSGLGQTIFYDEEEEQKPIIFWK